MTDFLPKNYSVPESPSRYLRFQEGQNKIRVLSPAIVGWEWWIDDKDGNRKPVRVKTQEEITADVQKRTGMDKARHFWAFVVYNYQEKLIQILEVKQASIQKSLKGMHLSDDWGDIRGYDVVITKVKTGSEPRDVEYRVMPTPKKELDKKIQEELENTPVNLEALFSGADPWELDIDIKKE